MKHKSKNGIIMKSSIKILAACSFMMLGVTMLRPDRYK